MDATDFTAAPEDNAFEPRISRRPRKTMRLS